jgi:hypothetical protein
VIDVKAQLGGTPTSTRGAVRVRRFAGLVVAAVLVTALAASAAAASPATSPAAAPVAAPAPVSTPAPAAAPTATPEPVVVAPAEEQAPRKLPPGGGSPVLLPR